MKVLIREDKTYCWSKGDLHTNEGVIKESDLKKNKSKIKSHLGKEFFVFPALFIDKVQKIKRLPQAILEKDIALILTYSSIDKNSVVLEAGTGSGKLTSFLARNVKKVVSYEKNKNYIKLAEENLRFLNIKNVLIKNKDIYDGIDEKNLDLIVLDLPNAEKVVKYACNSLKNGCFLVAYLININQAIEFVKEVNKCNFIIFKIVELIEREWLIDELRARPKNYIQGTAFLCFVRKI